MRHTIRVKHDNELAEALAKAAHMKVWNISSRWRGWREDWTSICEKKWIDPSVRCMYCRGTAARTHRGCACTVLRSCCQGGGGSIQLVEAPFEYTTEMDVVKVFRKRK